MKFSLIVPCFNEAANIPDLLGRLAVVAAAPDVEVVLVDNGSIDESAGLLRDGIADYPGFRLVTVKDNLGYGHGILEGLRAASGDVLGWTHADLQTDPKDALKGLELFDSHGKGIFVKGQRRGRPVQDVFFTIGMSAFESVLLQQKMWDINAQPTMFSREFFESWEAPPWDFSLDLYAYWRAQRENLPIHRFPVEFGVRKYGVSSWNTSWAEKRKFIKRTVSFSLELRKRKPK